MTLRQKQSLFVRLIARLIDHADSLGYELTFGEAWRSEWEATRLARAKLGIRLSLHRDRLAVDFYLFKNGLWLTTTEAHRPLGDWWEQQHPLCRWGGRFGDGNHYSLEHDGRR